MAENKKKIVGPLHYKIVQEDLVRSLQKKFYASDRSFFSFEYLTDQALERIDAHATSFNYDLEFNMDYPLHSLKRYIFVLNLLSNMKNLPDLSTQDERVALLIRLLDPELAVYRHYLANGYSLDKKGEADNDMEASFLLRAFESSIGTLDSSLLQYEMFYFRNVLKFNGFLFQIRRDFCTDFLGSLKNVETFRFVTELDYCDIQEKVRWYNELCESSVTPNAVCFNMNNPHGKLDLKCVDEKAIFFILACDPELRALRFSEEESTNQKIEDRCIRELGFYHPELLRIEKLFHRRFCPDKQVSPWSV